MGTNSPNRVTPAGLATGRYSDQYLTFILASEEYGVGILRVQEIRGWDGVTEIPTTPEHVRGVVNLRGVIVPVIDLRRRFGLAPLEYGKATVVIVVNAGRQGPARTVGFVVDAVSDVHHLAAEQRKAAPDFDGVRNTQLVQGLATIGDKLVILLDVDRLVDDDMLVSAQAAVEALSSEPALAAPEHRGDRPGGTC